VAGAKYDGAKTDSYSDIFFFIGFDVSLNVFALFCTCISWKILALAFLQN